jgi:hypothetical protein
VSGDIDSLPDVSPRDDPPTIPCTQVESSAGIIPQALSTDFLGTSLSEHTNGSQFPQLEIPLLHLDIGNQRKMIPLFLLSLTPFYHLSETEIQLLNYQSSLASLL